MDDNRALAVWVCTGSIVSAAVWGVSGREGDGFPALCEWVRWFVLEGPIDIALSGLSTISLIIAVINCRRFFLYRDTDYLRYSRGASIAGLTAAVTALVVHLTREGLMHM